MPLKSVTKWTTSAAVMAAMMATPALAGGGDAFVGGLVGGLIGGAVGSNINKPKTRTRTVYVRPGASSAQR